MKPKKCKHCGELFTPVYNATQQACSIVCAQAIARKNGTKRRAAQYRLDRDKLKTLSEWKADLQTVVNRYAKLKDKPRFEREGCISCGNKRPTSKYNAGHYLSRGARPEHRYDVDRNIFTQCEHCNTHLSGNQQAYRVNLCRLIGTEEVERLECDHEPKHYSIDDIKTMIKEFRKKIKAINHDFLD